MEKKVHPSFGKAVKGKGGSRAVDHPSMGGTAKGGDHKTMPLTSHAGGKPHKSMGGSEQQSYKSPKVKTYAQGPQGKQGGGY